MTATKNTADYAIKTLYPPELVASRWPGVRLIRDDGLSVFRHPDPPSRLYFVILHEASKTAQEVYLEPSLAQPRTRNDVEKLVATVESAMDVFWSDMNPDWPGLGPAGASR